jgi:hypothetical protein
LLLVSQSYGQAQVRVAKSYEDTVRVVILWNDPQGLCSQPWVGPQTRDYVVKSLDTTRVLNVRVLPTALFTDSTSWNPAQQRYVTTLSMIQNLWPGKMPHVIVHVNAGWGTHNGPNGNAPELSAILNWAVQNYIGVVEVGDDAAWLAQTVFRMNLVSNFAAGMGPATWLNKPADSLWVGLHPERDHLVDSTLYPFINGVVRNASRLTNSTRLFFKPYGSPSGTAYRCESDPDDFSLQQGMGSKVTFLGYQQGWNAVNESGDYDNAPAGQVGAVDRYTSIVVFQDTIIITGQVVIRRAVSLSFQPQYLLHDAGSEQVVYDAIMFASLAHTLRPVKVDIRVSDNSITAGSFAQLTADILPADLPQATKDRLSANVTWSLIPTMKQPGDSITATKGGAIQATATKAYRSLYVVATLYDSAFNATVYDTAVIYVRPGAPDHISIENDSMPDLWTPKDLPLLVITANQDTTNGAFAFFRDQFNNLCDTAVSKGRAMNSVWTSRNDQKIGVSPKTGSWWAKAYRISSTGADSGFVVASPSATYPTVKPDSVKVVVYNFYFTELRIVYKGTTIRVDSIGINTDQTVELEVQGMPSNAPGTWVSAAAYWILPSGPAVSPPLTNNQTQDMRPEWTFSPTEPTSLSAQPVKQLIVWNSNPQTKPDTAKILVTPAPPSRVEFVLIDKTPVAGEAFKAELRIYNTDGPVPGIWCYPGQGSGQVAYQDIIMKDVAPFPIVNTGSDTGQINQSPDKTSKVNQCFVNGVDTVTVTLYGPTGDQNLHQLTTYMAGAAGEISASTEKFALLPGPIARLVLVDPQNTPLPDAMTLNAPSGNVTALIVVYDAFGNEIPGVNGNWSTNGDIPQIDSRIATNTRFITYGTSTVQYASNGCIYARAVTNPSMYDSLCLTITAPPADYFAITGDTSGNGYLDRIELRFEKKVTLTNANIANISVTYGRTGSTFPVTQIIPGPGDSIYYLVLQQDSTTEPQTAWIPSVAITGIPEISPAPKLVYDGAGPVIWSAVEEINGQRATVTVTFSERIQRADGNSLNQASDLPAMMFNVWKKTNGVFDPNPITGMLDSSVIKSITTTPDGRSMVVFTMDCSGKDTATCSFLEPWNYLNIRILSGADSLKQVVDNNASNQLSANEPVLDNCRRQVLKKANEVTIVNGPNPFPPTAFWDNIDQNKLVFHNLDYLGDQIVVGRKGGTVIMAEITPPLNPAQWGPTSVNEIRAELKVYDIAGNLVFHRKTDHLIQDSPQWQTSYGTAKWEAGLTRKVYFVWGGLNDRGMSCAPGVYRALVYMSLDLSTQRSGPLIYNIKPASMAMGIKR